MTHSNIHIRLYYALMEVSMNEIALWKNDRLIGQPKELSLLVMYFFDKYY